MRMKVANENYRSIIKFVAQVITFIVVTQVAVLISGVIQFIYAIATNFHQNVDVMMIICIIAVIAGVIAALAAAIWIGEVIDYYFYHHS